MGIKRALTVGINYPGQPHFLRGCVNDSNTIKEMLERRFGFEDVVQLLDDAATTKRIKEELVNLVNGARAGDILFFHYSGHGTQIIDDHDPDHEPDGLDEVICPVDFDWRDNVIRDDDLKAIFDSVPAGVNLTVFLDCCNSGGGVDALNEYQAEVEDTPESPEGGRYLPPPADVQAKINASRLNPKPRQLSRNVNNSCMLISGAQAHQTAADARINGVYQGATTYFLQRALDELGPSATYHQIVNSLNRFMVEYGFSQRPQLDGSPSLHHETFLKEFSFGDPNQVAHYELPPEEDTDTQPTEPVNTDNKPGPNVTIDSSTTVNVGNNDQNKEDDKKDKDDDKDNKKTMMIVGAVVAVVAVVAVLMNL